MAPIDPGQLLKALSPLLSEDGGIKDADEVSRLSSLMKRFSRKLVSRCIYCCVLKATSPEILDIYLDQDGWGTLLLWIDEAKDNPSFLKELIGLLDRLPMTIDRLKSNSIAKIVKSLAKHEDIELAQQADGLVTKWMKLVKNNDDTKEKDRERRKERKDKDRSSKRGDEKKKDEKDRHKHKSSSRPEKDKDKERDRKDRKDKDRKKDKESSSSSGSSSGVKGEKRKDAEDREKSSSKKLKTSGDAADDMTDVVPPRPPTPPELRKPKSERPKTVKEFGSKLRLASFLEDDASAAKLQKKKLTKPSTASSNALSKPPVPLSSLRNLSGPGGVRASIMSAHMNQTEQQVGNIKLIAPPKPAHLIIENEGFMNALNASAPTDKSSQAAVKKKRKLNDTAAATTTSSAKKNNELKRENSKDESGNEDNETPADAASAGFDNSNDDSSESPSKASKEPPPQLSFYKDTLEDEDSQSNRRTLRSRTRKAIVDEDSNAGDSSEEPAEKLPKLDDASQESSSSSSSTSSSLPMPMPLPLSPSRDDAGESTENNTKEGSAEPEEEGISVVLQTSSEAASNPAGVKSILTIVTNRNRVKKAVRWKDDADLRTFHYFEHDPNERVNVNNINHLQQGLKVDGSVDIKMIEMRMERERLRAPNDRMEEQQQWSMPVLIEFVAERQPCLKPHEIGKSSEMAKLEAVRQASVLEVLYFNRRMIPESPAEPDPENRRSSIESATETKMIPLEDVDTPAQDSWQPQQDAPAALPEALSNLLANMSTPQIGPQQALGPPEIPIIPPEPQFPLVAPLGPPLGPQDMVPPLFIPTGGPPGANGPPMPPVHMSGAPGPPGPPPRMMHMMPDSDGGHWAPMGGPPVPPVPPVPPPHMNNERRRGRGGNRNNIRGPPRTLCKFFKQGHCRFGAGCTFLHPGVNGPDHR